MFVISMICLIELIQFYPLRFSRYSPNVFLSRLFKNLAKILVQLFKISKILANIKYVFSNSMVFLVSYLEIRRSELNRCVGFSEK